MPTKAIKGFVVGGTGDSLAIALHHCSRGARSREARNQLRWFDKHFGLGATVGRGFSLPHCFLRGRDFHFGLGAAVGRGFSLTRCSITGKVSRISSSLASLAQGRFEGPTGISETLVQRRFEGLMAAATDHFVHSCVGDGGCIFGGVVRAEDALEVVGIVGSALGAGGADADGVR